MEVVTKKRMMIFSGSSHEGLAKEVAEHLGMRVGEVELSRFANGELYCRFGESVRGADVFVMQTHVSDSDRTINDYVVEQMLMFDALKRASAKRIIAVIPYFGYSRSDKKTLAREPIGAKLMCDLLEAAGVDRIMSVDLHTGQIQGFSNVPFDHLTAMPLIEGWIQDNVPPGERVIVSPDAGRVRLTEKFGQHLSAPMAILHKTRDPREHNKSETREVIGEVEGKIAIIIDDMIDTAGTICGAARMLMDRGATSVIACATHGLLSGPAPERLIASVIDTTVVTNTLPIPPERQFPGLVVLSIAPIVAPALKAVFEDESVSQIFQGENV